MVFVSLGATFVVHVRSQFKWYKGFLISLLYASAALICIVSGKRFYCTPNPGGSPLLGILQGPFLHSPPYVLYIAIQVECVSDVLNTDMTHTYIQFSQIIIVFERVRVLVL